MGTVTQALLMLAQALNIADRVRTLLAQANTEGREPTQAELDALDAELDADYADSRKERVKTIARRRAEDGK